MDLGLNEFISPSYQEKEPDNLDFIYYLFWEKGFSETDMEKMSLPYIFSILKTYTFTKAEEEKAHKKAMRK